MYQIPRNALVLLLTAQAMVILPHVLRLPAWITLFCVGCGLWRVMVYRGRWSYPGRWVKAAFVVGGFFAIGFGYGTLLGLEPWVGILIVAFALKLLEMHQQRDAYTVIVLGYFVALTEFLFQQTIPFTLYVYLCVTVITAALIAMNQRTADSVSPVHTLKKASLLLAQSLPLMIVLFVLFPRIGPLWTVPLPSDVARSGVSDTMAPGNIASLVQSDELAFRATFDGQAPSNRQLYWRGLVLSYFDGEEQTWRQEKPGLYGQTLRAGRDVPDWHDNMEYLGDPLNYSIIMEPTHRNWMFSLDLPQPSDIDRVGLVRDGRFYSFPEISSRFRYELTSYLDHRTDLQLTDFWRYRYTLIPENDNPETQALARQMREAVDTPREFMRDVLRRYAYEDYYYTLTPGVVEGDTIDEFLFRTQNGFCEHFAGSFVYMMRAGGVPARVVIGYQGGEFNQRGNYVAVYQFDAHAWAEVWFEGEGWVRVDPTAVVAPERIERGLESAVSGDAFLQEAGLSLMRFRSNLLLTELRLQISALNHYWDAWVVGYNPGIQMNLLRQFFGDIDRQTLGIILLSAFFGVLTIVGLFLMLKRSHRKLTPVDQQYLKFCNYLATKDLARYAGEGPIAYANRIGELRPELSDDIRQVTDAYVKANFEDNNPEAIGALRQRIRKLRLKAAV